jgi:hypothetical protein
MGIEEKEVKAKCIETIFYIKHSRRRNPTQKRGR